MGSSLAAFLAGYTPKNIPTPEEIPIASTTAGIGTDMGTGVAVHAMGEPGTLYAARLLGG